MGCNVSKGAGQQTTSHNGQPTHSAADKQGPSGTEQTTTQRLETDNPENKNHPSDEQTPLEPADVSEPEHTT
ncbi:hypothetical protein DPMN_040637 [Dreissena polymorpha]|uniref:Uncharacterized protein n=1 Tax=Dreissena polymorpha TaxID=45954 RepID=A0A9D4HV88_DREPO|nr:hypothetical protein DPMN_040637 [Dreissena polymorpha]